MAMHKFLKLAIAPMIDWSDTHFRVWMRMLAPCAFLYTEMQTPGAIVHNPKRSLLYSSMENPLALQVGSADKEDLVICAKIAQDHGFSELNLNVGCPSSQVQAGQFGACLMLKPTLVAECVLAMKQAVNIPISVKTRIGVDNTDDYPFFASFAHKLAQAGCDKLIVHARKAWLKGLNPKQNRTIPPLHYPYVYQIKQEMPQMPVVINGNIQSLVEVQGHLQQVDGVMLGRLACQNPYAIALIHHNLHPDIPLPSRHEALQRYASYVQTTHVPGMSLAAFIKPILNGAHGLSGAKKWKKSLLEMQQSRDSALLPKAIDSLCER